MSRSKRLNKVAHAAPHDWSHRNGGYSAPKTHLIQSPIFLLLIPHVGSDYFFVPPNFGGTDNIMCT